MIRMRIRVKSRLRVSIFAISVYCLMLMAMWTSSLGEKLADFIFEGSTIYCKNEGINDSWWMERGE